MRLVDAARILDQGRSVTMRPTGNSMTPIIRSGQKVTVSPLVRPPKQGDVVLAKISGRYYLHLVTRIRHDRGKTRYQISNNHGFVNGWASQVHGIVTEIG